MADYDWLRVSQPLCEVVDCDFVKVCRSGIARSGGHDCMNGV